MVNGAADQARASSSRLTRSNWRTSQPQGVAAQGLGGSPGAQHVHQSPPASADATRVSILSPGFARPGALSR